MTELHHNLDEVDEFHPVVEEKLEESTEEAGFQDSLQVKHHPDIPSSSTKPDFVLYLDDRPILVLEVKRTKRACDSERHWADTREYVKALENEWHPNCPKYFAVTNVERLYLLCDREGPVNGCVLAGNPRLDNEFGPLGPNNANKPIQEFKVEMESVLEMIRDGDAPEWADTWPLVIDSFKTNYESVKGSLGLDDQIKERDISSYELLRILLYGYLKELYGLRGENYSSVFRNLPEGSTPPESFVRRLINLYERVLDLDFDQVFKNHPDEDNRLIPDNFDEEIVSYLRNFIGTINRNLKTAVEENRIPSYFQSLMKNRVYDREELHNEGKVTTDEGLASLLAGLCIQSPEDDVFDLGTGLGSLSSSAYDRLNDLSFYENIEKSHNEILSQISGIEKDPFLNQLATFRLVAKSPTNVDSDTKIDFKVGDAFENPEPESYDVLLMNPPFVRHDNQGEEGIPYDEEMEERMERAIEHEISEDCFAREAKQPNLYFYFLNWVPHYLRHNGVAGIILMAKFLNNVDGEYVKEFILDDLESIIFYPREFMEEYKSTTCILILRKGTDKDKVEFLRLKSLDFLEKPDKIESMLSLEGDVVVEPDFSLKRVSKRELNPSDNWLPHLQDPEGKAEFINELDVLRPLKEMFSHNPKRGSAGNSGGTKTIFLNESGNPLSSYASSVGHEFIGPGLHLNKLQSGRRQFILEEEDVQAQEALHVPSKYDEDTGNGLSEEFQENAGLDEYFTGGKEEHGDKWKSIVNSVYSSEITPDLIIPRADREKHSVYCWLNDDDLVISTNFWYIEDFEGNEEELKCVCGYLMSSFGQIQFEIEGNNHEGMRKLEGEMIKEFNSFDIDELDSNEIERVAEAFEDFNELDQDVRGDEGVTTAREGLDRAVGEIIFSRSENQFDSVEDLVKYFELFLEDLVNGRAM